MKLETIKKIYESSELKISINKIDFSKLIKEDIVLLLNGTRKEDRDLLRTYHFDAYDIIDFSEKISKCKYAGFKHISMFDGNFHMYTIVIENSNGKIMEHNISIHIGRTGLYAEIFDGKEIEVNPANINSSPILSLIHEIDQAAKNKSKSSGDLAELIYALDAKVQEKYHDKSWLRSWYDDVSEIAETLDDGSAWSEVKQDWTKLKKNFLKRFS